MLMDRSPQLTSLGEIFDLSRAVLIEGDVLQPFSLTEAIRKYKVTEIVHMVQAALKNEEVLIPSSRTEWVYSKDAAEGTVLALKAGALNRRVFNMTMGRLNGPEELTAALKAVVPGVKVKVSMPTDGSPALQDNKYSSDLSAAKEHIGYEPKYQMLEAVRDMAEWLRSRAAC